MPIYEFECTCCPSRFELKRSFHDETPVSCPACGKNAQRRFSSVPIIFKGSGFYVTDHKGSQSYTSTSESSSDAGADAGKAEPAKTEAGSAKKAEAKVGSAKED